MMDGLYQVILFGAVLTALSIMTSIVSRRVGAPSLLLFLLLGMLAGEEGFGGISFDDFNTAFVIGNLALAVILLDGGSRTHASSFRVGLAPSLTLATVGVAITAGIVGAAAAMALGWPWTEGFLVGAIVGSTDAAAVFGLLHAAGLELKQRSGATLEIESGTNDPMAIFLTITLVTLLSEQGELSGFALVGNFVQQMGLGAIFGAAGGVGLGWLVNRLTLPLSLYPLLVMSVGLAVFSLTSLAGGSGFLAVYLIGLLLANRPLDNRHDIQRFLDGMAWISQIGMFLILGLLVTPSSLLEVIYPGIIVALVLIFIARPVAVALCLLPFRFPWQEQAFISWVGLKGAVPIILALFPFLSGLENSATYFQLTFFVVLLSLCLQGWTIAPVARWLRLEVPPHQEDFQQLSLRIPDHPGWELLAYRVHSGSAADAYRVRKLPLPEGTKLMGVVRRGHVLAADADTDLEPDDYLILLTQAHDLAELSPLFQELPTANYLRASEFFGQFSLRGDTRLRDVAGFYMVPLPKENWDNTLAQFIARRYHGKPVVGDRVRVGNVEFVVRQIVGGEIFQVGLKILPAAA
ncbi:potassium/proton antiporter [Gilvimarinus sp. F26214L]|uniref:potassium/proton antiporter n=1 Tax=Gilvimarinus sp. DZF01 TaxID=3461371 RepID=UPI00404656A4